MASHLPHEQSLAPAVAKLVVARVAYGLGLIILCCSLTACDSSEAEPSDILDARTWQRVDLSSSTAYQRMKTFPDGYVYALKSGRLVRTMNGLTWEQVSDIDGIQDFVFHPGGVLVALGTYTQDGRLVLRSSDMGRTWEERTHLTLGNEDLLLSAQGDLVVGGPAGVYRSDDAGLTWEYVFIRDTCGDSRLPTMLFNLADQEEGLTSVFAHACSENFMSVDGGLSWQSVGTSGWPSSGWMKAPIDHVVGTGSGQLLGIHQAQSFVTDPHHISWSSRAPLEGSGLQGGFELDTYHLAKSQSGVLLATGSTEDSVPYGRIGLCVSHNSGDSWACTLSLFDEIEEELPNSPTANCSIIDAGFFLDGRAIINTYCFDHYRGRTYGSHLFISNQPL